MEKSPIYLLDHELEQFPDVVTYINSLKKLQNLDLSSASLYEIKKAVLEHALFIRHIYGTYKPENFNRLTFYRARLNVKKETDDLELLRTYSYPSPCYCTSNGRANLKGKSVFYCSNQPLTAIKESKPKSGEIGYLSVWKGNTTRNLKIGVCLPPNIKNENEWHGMAKEAHNASKDFSSTYDKDKSRHLLALTNFIAEQFVLETPPYPITSWLSDEMLYGEQWKDFIIYPSVTNESYSCNMAFHPNIADLFLKFEKVIRFRVDECEKDRIAIAIGSVGEINNANIEWRNAKPEELNFNNYP
jgi:hypothetical protein